MKKIALLLMVFFAGTAASFCQTSDAEMEAMINLLGVQKKEAIAKLVHVTGKDADVF
ncbi:MAG TPA: hypothetical protein VLB74_05710 [Flavobacterium sp.]|uniref:hypothetical protein n=1 Tax=Flavobacterium sp. TaxID=239 RepID=UPI002D1CF4C2|nr:hypothetical protein [Flavobacterium sp.]HSD14122.1 hypothetical protein [Flavobacterium sp.]